jgi:hypothetical protein
VVADDDGAGGVAGAGADEAGASPPTAGGVAGAGEPVAAGGASGVSALSQPASTSAPTSDVTIKGVRNRAARGDDGAGGCVFMMVLWNGWRLWQRLAGCCRLARSMPERRGFVSPRGRR